MVRDAFITDLTRRRRYGMRYALRSPFGSYGCNPRPALPVVAQYDGGFRLCQQQTLCEECHRIPDQPDEPMLGVVSGRSSRWLDWCSCDRISPGQDKHRSALRTSGDVVESAQLLDVDADRDDVGYGLHQTFDDGYDCVEISLPLDDGTQVDWIMSAISSGSGRRC